MVGALREVRPVWFCVHSDNSSLRRSHSDARKGESQYLQPQRPGPPRWRAFCACKTRNDSQDQRTQSESDLRLKAIQGIPLEPYNADAAAEIRTTTTLSVRRDHRLELCTLLDELRSH